MTVSRQISPSLYRMFCEFYKGLIKITVCWTAGTDCLGCFRNNIREISPKAEVRKNGNCCCENDEKDWLNRHSGSSILPLKSFTFLIWEPAVFFLVSPYCLDKVRGVDCLAVEIGWNVWIWAELTLANICIMLWLRIEFIGQEISVYLCPEFTTQLPAYYFLSFGFSHFLYWGNQQLPVWYLYFHFAQSSLGCSGGGEVILLVQVNVWGKSPTQPQNCSPHPNQGICSLLSELILNVCLLF